MPYRSMCILQKIYLNAIKNLNPLSVSLLLQFLYQIHCTNKIYDALFLHLYRKCPFLSRSYYISCVQLLLSSMMLLTVLLFLSFIYTLQSCMYCIEKIEIKEIVHFTSQFCVTLFMKY